MRKSSDRVLAHILNIREGTRNPNVAKCLSWSECSATICPLVPDAGIWYAGEAVCRSRKHGVGLRWLRVQRRIARLEHVDGGFVVEDLDRIKKVRAGITGTNPDAPADRRRNGPAQRQGASRGGVARVGAGGLDSESQARQSLA